MAAMIDDFCIVRSMYTDLPIHEPALFLMNCGNRLAGHPSMGSWVTYGLGTENQNLPGYVVIAPGVVQAGTQLWSSGFLPGAYQGCQVRNTVTDPAELVPFVRNPKLTSAQQTAQLHLLAKLNQGHMAEVGGSEPAFESSIQSMETAFRMQTAALDAFDASKESQPTRDRYGDNEFGRGCLLARRLIERGVRMVQVYYGKDSPWDHHDDIMQMRDTARVADRAIPALLTDLKATGLWKETLVIVSGEFGRTPTVQVGGPIQVIFGRDHNPQGFTTLLAGGAVKPGPYGATDEFGVKAVEKPVHVHDLHATVLHILGLDHKRLTFRHSGRDYRLTDVAGEVVKEILI
jgi:hypothetical protein